ncbi:unnamed protein product [Caenorhabditis brenneri]
MSSESPSTASKEIWERPLPGHVLIEKLPGIDPCREMSLKEFNTIIKKKTNLYKPTKDDNIKVVVLDEIRKTPKIWMTKSLPQNDYSYAMVAINVYKRTGKVLDLVAISAAYKYGKDALRTRMKTIMYKKNILDPVLIEEELWKWNIYPFIRFYRRNLAPWEQFMRKQAIEAQGGQTQNQQQFEENSMDYGHGSMEPVEPTNYHMEEQPMKQESDGLDDIIEVKAEKIDPTGFEMIVKHEPDSSSYGDNNMYNYAPQSSYSPQQHQHINYSNGYQYSDQHQMHMNPMPMVQSSPAYKEQMSRGGVSSPSDVHSASSSSSSVDPSSAAIKAFENEISQISFQALRIARENPERIKLLRKVLFTAVLAVDDKEYNTAGEVFRDLGQRNP